MRVISALNAEEIERAGSVVLFDDSLNSGVQCSCLLASWLGASDLCAHRDDMDPDGPRPGDVVQALREVPISFVFYSRHPQGEAQLAETCEALGLNLREILSVVDALRDEFRLAGVRCATARSTERLLEHLQHLGEYILREKLLNKSPGWDEDRVRRFALGYGGIDLTLVYRHGISASTPVALWMPILPSPDNGCQCSRDGGVNSGSF
jgi:hypothetical protein